jgi:hypothetical protein
MGLMLITVGDSSTMEVSKEDIQKYLSYIRGQRHFLADPMLMEMNEWFEDLLELIDGEETKGTDITHEIADIIADSGEGMLNDEGVDFSVCMSTAEAIHNLLMIRGIKI